MRQWSGELKVVSVESDRVVLYLHPSEASWPFEPGVVLGGAFAEIASPEAVSGDRRPPKYAPRGPSNMAAMLCRDPRFQLWAARMMREEGSGALPATEAAARAFILRQCRIRSRSELDTNADAHLLYQTRVEIPFYKEGYEANLRNRER